MRQQLDVDAFAHGLPGPCEQRLLHFREPPLGRADQIGDRRIGLAHLAQHVLGRNAAVHHPDALRLAVLRLDLLEEAPQRGVVGGVAREHLIGQRQALGRHDQGDHQLHAVAALVATVAVPAFVGVVVRRIGLEIGARQIVQQNLELGAEQILPARPQVIEERRLVRQQLVEAAIQRVLGDQRIVLAEQIPHRALLEP